MPQYLDAQGRPTAPSSGAPKKRYLNSAGESDTTGPVDGGFFDAVGNMGATDWTALATRLGGGLFGNSGGPLGAVVGAASEGLAQLQEGRGFRPWEIAAQAGIGLVPFGRFLGTAAKPLMKEAGALSSAVNAAGNVGAGAAKGAVVGGTTTGLQTGIAEGRAPSRTELLTGLLLGAGGGAAGSAFAKAAAGGGAPVDVPSARPRLSSGPPVAPWEPGQRGLFDMPVNPAVDVTAPVQAPQPRILRGKEMYKGTYPADRDITDPVFGGRAQRPPRQDSFEDLVQMMSDEQQPRVLRNQPSGADLSATDPRFSGRRAPFVPEMGDTPQPFGGMRGASQMPLGEASDPLDVLSEALGLTPKATVSAPMDANLSGRTALMDRMRQTADMGQPSFPRAGDPEVLPPFQPGAEWFMKEAGEFGPPPGADMTPDDMIAELLGGVRRPESPSALVRRPEFTQKPDIDVAPASASEVAPKPKIPIEITRAWQNLKPKWQASVDAQRADDIPFTVDPSEDLLPFAKRIIGETDPRKLWNAERKAAAEIGPDRLDVLRQFLMGDEGSVNTELARHLGAGAAGAVAMPMLEGNTDDPAVSAIGGGLAGVLASVAAKNPKLIERMRSSGLFSGMAIPKSFLGNMGGLASYGLENPGSGRALLEEIFNPETTTALKAGFNRPTVSKEAGMIFNDGPLSYPGRLIGAPDFASRDIMQRVEGRMRGGNLPGIPTPAQATAGGEYTLSGDPYSKAGKWMLDASERPVARALAPVIRTPINWLERGLERIPGIGNTKTVAGWTGGGRPDLVRRRQVLGLGALGVGGAAGAAAAGSEAGDLDVNPLPIGPQNLEDALPFLSAAAGPFGLPLTLGVQGGKKLMSKGGNPISALESMAMETQDSLPLPTNFSRPSNMVRSVLPYSAAMRALSPVDPRELDTSGSFFGPTLAQIPGLNEWLFNRKRKAQPRVEFGRAQK